MASAFCYRFLALVFEVCLSDDGDGWIYWCVVTANVDVVRRPGNVDALRHCEAQVELLSQLRHPNIITYYTYFFSPEPSGRPDGTLNIVLE